MVWTRRLAEAQDRRPRQRRSGMIALSIDGKSFPPKLLKDQWISGHYFQIHSKRQHLLATSDMAYVVRVNGSQLGKHGLDSPLILVGGFRGLHRAS